MPRKLIGVNNSNLLLQMVYIAVPSSMICLLFIFNFKWTSLGKMSLCVCVCVGMNKYKAGKKDLKVLEILAFLSVSRLSVLSSGKLS